MMAENFKARPVGLGEVALPPWRRGSGPYDSNKIFAIDPVDGSKKLVAEVHGYSMAEVEANINVLIRGAMEIFFHHTP